MSMDCRVGSCSLKNTPQRHKTHAIYKVVYLHGGPGGGTSPDDRRYFNPQEYRIIVFDQRGAGKSTPYVSIASFCLYGVEAE